MNGLDSEAFVSHLHFSPHIILKAPDVWTFAL